jgi:hypothetical protein
LRLNKAGETKDKNSGEHLKFNLTDK